MLLSAIESYIPTVLLEPGLPFRIFGSRAICGCCRNTWACHIVGILPTFTTLGHYAGTDNTYQGYALLNVTLHLFILQYTKRLHLVFTLRSATLCENAAGGDHDDTLPHAPNADLPLFDTTMAI